MTTHHIKKKEVAKKTDAHKTVTEGFIAEGTICESCATIIKKQARKVEGVIDVNFDYASETGEVTFDPQKTDVDKILDSIEEKGYTCFLIAEDDEAPQKKKSPMGWVFGLIGLALVVYFILQLSDTIALPELSQNMSLGLLFVVGLLTGFHCVGMCGAFVVSYTAKDAQAGRKSHKSHLMYAVGKTISYTIIGAMFGLVGSIIAFTPVMRGVAGLLAGLFLILFGLKMLNIVPALRHIQIRMPKFLIRFVGKESSKHSSPLVIGLLNGLMIACGPLQAIYIMAAGTGSMIEGAKLLFVFGLGTLPVMLGFGYITSIISQKMTHKILKASGVVVIILGVLMVNTGLVLTGTGFDAGSLVQKFSARTTSGNAVLSTPELAGVEMDGNYQIIRMDVTRYGWEPSKFVLKKGVPVKWIINGKEINGCNNAIQVPKYGLKFDIKPGEQTIEFTPTEEGVIPWSCWMGMIPGTFIVKDGIDITDTQAIQEELDAVPTPTGGTCGGAAGGGCGCGGA